jgi:hypothetical protein
MNTLAIIIVCSLAFAMIGVLIHGMYRIGELK